MKKLEKRKQIFPGYIIDYILHLCIRIIFVHASKILLQIIIFIHNQQCINYCLKKCHKNSSTNNKMAVFLVWAIRNFHHFYSSTNFHELLLFYGHENSKKTSSSKARKN